MKITLEDFLKTVKKGIKTETPSAEVAPAEEKTAKQKLADYLDDAQSAYDNSPYRTYSGNKITNYKEKVYNAPTDAEIAEQANEKETAAADAKRDKLVSDAVEKFGNYETLAASLNETAADAVKKLSNTYEAAKEKAANSAIKRGIGRSSIATGQAENLENAKRGAIGEAYSNRDKGLAEIDANIAALAEDLSSAINELDIETAVRINDTIAALKEQREKAKAEADSYNEKIRNKKASELNALAAKGVAIKDSDSEEYAEMLYNKLRALYEYYYGLGDEAKGEIEADKDFIEGHVGKGGFNYLKNYFGKKNS